MPWRLGDKFPNRAKVQFTTSASMPNRIYQACLKTGIVSNTAYCQLALCEALSRDLGIPLDDLLAELPAARGPAGHLYDPENHTMNRHQNKTMNITGNQAGGPIRVGPANTDEEVR